MNSERTESLLLIRIEPNEKRFGLGLREAWEFRRLLYWLLWRDIRLRYKQTIMGSFWALLQPVSIMLVLAFFLGFIARFPSDGLPYTVFVIAGIVPWTFFSSTFTTTANSLASNRALISKIYFPRLVIAFSAVGVPIIDFLVMFAFLIAVTLYFGIVPRPEVAFVPLFALLGYFAAVGLGMWFAALNVRYRDVQFVVPFIVQAGMFASAVIYPFSLVPEGLRLYFAFNPMVTVVEGFRWAMFGTGLIGWEMILLSSAVVVVFLVSGLAYFHRVERTLVDTL